MRRGVLQWVPAGLVLALMLGGGVAGAVAVRGGSLSPLGTGPPNLGLVTITPGCTVSNPLAPIAVTGDDFTLEGGLNGSLLIECPDANFNGNGFTINYTNVTDAEGDGAAITVGAVPGVVVDDVSSSNDSVGLRAAATTGLAVQQTSLTGSAWAINTFNTVGTEITSNTFTDGSGVWLGNASDALVEQNHLDGSSRGIDVQDGSQLTIMNNQLANIAGSAAVSVTGVSGVTIEGNHAPGSDTGIEVVQSSQVTIEGNNASLGVGAAWGIGLLQDTDATVSGNLAVDDAFPFWVNGGSDVVLNQDNGSGAYQGLWAAAVTSLQASDLNVSGAHNFNATANQSAGVEIQASVGVHLTDINASRSEVLGAVIRASSDVTLLDSNLSHAGANATEVNGSNHVNVSASNGSFSPLGFVAFASQAVTFENDVADVGDAGFAVDFSQGVTIRAAQVYSQASDGISLYAVTDARLTDDRLGDVSNGPGISTAGCTNVTAIDDRINATLGGLSSYEDSNWTFEYNSVSNVSDTGLSFFQDDAAIAIDGNAFRAVGLDAVNIDESDGPVTIVDNTLPSPTSGVVLTACNGTVTIHDNDITGASIVAIGLDLVQGGIFVTGNDVAHSAEALDIQNANSQNSYYTGVVAFNNASNSSEVDLEGSYLVGGVIGNDLLNVSEIVLSGGLIGPVDHNDFNTTAVTIGGHELLGGYLNASYPIGGNYWTGYLGDDLFSGPAQDLPGSDGIGDTPLLVDGYLDEYPLMHPWAPATLTFTEGGLPAGASWSVTLNGENQSAVAGAAISFLEPNGANTSYSYTARSGVATYTAEAPTGSGIEDDRSAQIALVFEPVAEPVIFEEEGLPAGTDWTVLLSGGGFQSTSPAIDLALLNGTYSYTVRCANLSYSAVGGTATVSGLTAVTVTFTEVTYAVTFEATDLSLGATGTWSVNITGRAPLTAGTPAIAVPLPNGTYRFDAGTTVAGAFANGGTFEVRGGAVTESVAFAEYYLVTFRVSGLPTGDSWSVSLGGSTYTATASTITLHLPDGSYGYAVSAPAGDSVTPSTGTLTVTGAATGVTVAISTPAKATNDAPTIDALTGGLVAVAILAVAGWALALRGRRRGGNGPTAASPPEAVSGGGSGGPPSGGAGPG